MLRRLDVDVMSGLGADVCLLEESDPQRFLALSRTKDGAFVVINSNSKTDSEASPLYPTDQP
jgi:protease II